MTLRTLLPLSVLSLAACATATRPAEQPAPQFTRVEQAPEPPRPVEIVEIPKPIPFPQQLKPLPHLSPPTPDKPSAEDIEDANAAARIEPAPSGFINAVQVWPYTEGALYQLYTTPGRNTDIALEPGEELIDVSPSDSSRWIIGDTRSGTGPDERQHLILKPIREGLTASLMIFTNRRTYHLELHSTPETWMAAVSWNYPQAKLERLRAQNRAAEAQAQVVAGLRLEKIRFDYELSGDNPGWRPAQVFHDDEKVYILFPDGIAQQELPPLFVIGPDEEIQLVNYRHPPGTRYYIVDRLFEAAELRLGGKRASVVRITRSQDHRTHRSARTDR